MDYERYYSYSNARIYIIIVIFLLGFNYYIHPMDLIFKKPVIENTTPINNTVIVYKERIVTVTPTIDGITYFAGEYESGLRKLGRLFSWYNEDVTGLKDMSGHIKVYDYRMFTKIHAYDYTENSYYEINAPNGKRFLFIFVKAYLDDISGDDTRLYLPREDHFLITAKNTVYSPDSWDKTVRVRELEETWNDNNDYRIGYYGVFNTYSKDKQYVKTAGMVAENVYYVRGGMSNAVDGYIVYTIPDNIDIDDIQVMGNMYAFGTPVWSLKK
jgi:hypothetical protein